MSIDIEKIKRRLPVDLTLPELLERGERLSMLLRQIESSDQERKAEDKRRKKTISGLESDAAEVSEQISSRQERRDVECEARYDLDRCLCTIVRLDTYEAIETKTMDRYDVDRRRQTRMDLQGQAVEGDSMSVDAELEPDPEADVNPEPCFICGDPKHCTDECTAAYCSVCEIKTEHINGICCNESDHESAKAELAEANKVFDEASK